MDAKKQMERTSKVEELKKKLLVSKTKASDVFAELDEVSSAPAAKGAGTGADSASTAGGSADNLMAVHLNSDIVLNSDELAHIGKGQVRRKFQSWNA